MTNQSLTEIFTAHFKTVGDMLIKINQEFLTELLIMRNAESKAIYDEHIFKMAIKQTHYVLVRRYVIDGVNTLFN